MPRHRELSATDKYTMQGARYLLDQKAHHDTEPLVTADLCDVHLRALYEMQPAVGKGSLIIDLENLKTRVLSPKLV